jgi:ubiquinone biosynthesis protein
MWTTSDPVVREWIARNLGPAGRLEQAATSTGTVLHFLGELPNLLARTGRLMERLDEITHDGLHTAPESIEANVRAEAGAKRWTTLALWIIAAALLWIAWMSA